MINLRKVRNLAELGMDLAGLNILPAPRYKGAVGYLVVREDELDGEPLASVVAEIPDTVGVLVKGEESEVVVGLDDGIYSYGVDTDDLGECMETTREITRPRNIIVGKLIRQGSQKLIEIIEK